MKRLFTLLLPFLFLININAQYLEQLSPESIEASLVFQNHQNNPSPQVELRTPFVLDSSYMYQLPDDDLILKSYPTYNSHGSILSYCNYKFYNNTNTWENQSKIEFERDTEDRVIEKTYTSADQNTFEWVPHIRKNFTWDASENIIQSFSSDWNSSTSSFLNNLKWDYTYDSDDLLIDKYLYRWDENISDWENFQYATYTYDSNGNLIEEAIEVWSDSINDYTSGFKNLYEYDIDQNLIKSTNQNWDEINLVWENVNQVRSIYDNGLKTTQYTDYWVELPFGFQFLAHIQVLYSYDSNGNLVEEIFNDYYFDNEMWEGNRRWVHFYSDVDTEVEAPNNSTLNCFSGNPIRTGEIINCQDLDLNNKYNLIIFDVSGKVLLEKKFQGGVEVKLPSVLESGIYFMNILHDEKIVLKDKIIVID